MNSPPVLKISEEVTRSSTDIGEAHKPARTNETATPPSAGDRRDALDGMIRRHSGSATTTGLRRVR